MSEISKISQRLLKEIIKYNADVDHFNDYFNLFCDLNKTKYKNENILRTAFGELEEFDMINIEWADDVLWNLSVTSKGYSFLSEKNHKKFISFIKWFIGILISIIAIIIQFIK